MDDFGFEEDSKIKWNGTGQIHYRSQITGAHFATDWDFVAEGWMLLSRVIASYELYLGPATKDFKCAPRRRNR